MKSPPNELQSNFDGSNLFGTMKICSRLRLFEPRKVTIGATPGGIMETIVGYLFGVLYFKCMLCALIRVHTVYIYKIKEENLPKLSVYRIWRKSLRTQERVRLVHGKRAIGVRAIEVLLYTNRELLFDLLSGRIQICGRHLPFCKWCLY